LTGAGILWKSFLKFAGFLPYIIEEVEYDGTVVHTPESIITILGFGTA
jgi:hypothetical protein